MEVYKTRGFARFARRERITDEKLCEAVARAESGLVDADLGGGVIKQRVSRTGRGRSGGFRVIVIYRTSTRTVFIDGFAKSDQDAVKDVDLARFKDLAREFLGHKRVTVQTLVKSGAWIEVSCDE